MKQTNGSGSCFDGIIRGFVSLFSFLKQTESDRCNAGRNLHGIVRWFVCVCTADEQTRARQEQKKKPTSLL